MAIGLIPFRLDRHPRQHIFKFRLRLTETIGRTDRYSRWEPMRSGIGAPLMRVAPWARLLHELQRRHGW